MQQSKLPIADVTPKEVLIEPWESIPFDYAAFKERAERITNLRRRYEFIIETEFTYHEKILLEIVNRQKAEQKNNYLKMKLRGFPNNGFVRGYEPEDFYTPAEKIALAQIKKYKEYTKEITDLEIATGLEKGNDGVKQHSLQELKKKYDSSKIIVNEDDAFIEGVYKQINGILIKETSIEIFKEHFINQNYRSKLTGDLEKLWWKHENTALTLYVNEMKKSQGLIINRKIWVAVTSVFVSNRGEELTVSALSRTQDNYLPRVRKLIYKITDNLKVMRGEKLNNQGFERSL